MGKIEASGGPITTDYLMRRPRREAASLAVDRVETMARMVSQLEEENAKILSAAGRLMDYTKHHKCCARECVDGEDQCDCGLASAQRTIRQFLIQGGWVMEFLIAFLVLIAFAWTASALAVARNYQHAINEELGLPIDAPWRHARCALVARESAMRDRGEGRACRELVEWMEDPDRQPANVAFTHGPVRQLAYRIETLLEQERTNDD